MKPLAVPKTLTTDTICCSAFTRRSPRSRSRPAESPPATKCREILLLPGDDDVMSHLARLSSIEAKRFTDSVEVDVCELARVVSMLAPRGVKRLARRDHEPGRGQSSWYLVVPLAGSTEPILEQVVRLQFAEHPRPLPPPIAQYPRYRQFGVVVQNRLRHAAEELKRRGMAGAKCLRRLLRLRLHEAGIAVRQVHCEVVGSSVPPRRSRPDPPRSRPGHDPDHGAAEQTPPAAAVADRAHSPSRSSDRRRSRARPEGARRSASKCAAASPDDAYPPQGSGR